MTSALDRAAYVIGQGARVGLFMGQSWLSGRLTKPVKAARPITGPFPSTARLRRDMAKLFAQDWRNIEAGHYRVPHDLIASPIQALAKAAPYFADLRGVERRRHARDGAELRSDEKLEDLKEDFPAYYLQNFHYQTDGYLSRRSADLYDHQVEVLFTGAADAMRRQALVPLAAFLAERRSAETSLLDLACGTGRFLTFVKDNYPRLQVTALDLSPAYLDKARALLAPWRGVDFQCAPAEASGFSDESQDVITCIYLFHELPRKVRGQIAREAKRLLKPGGRLIFLDSIQLGDMPDYDGLLQYFPEAFHEPFYADYQRDDLEGTFAAAGLELVASELAYFSRLMVLAKAP
ncbi:MAG: class I SAM-dependent methyltransferase [Pseudomonadota bacterium]